MYLAPLLILIAVAAVIGSIFSGGIGTIVLVPVAVIAVAAAALLMGAARGAGFVATLEPNPPEPNPAPRNAEPKYPHDQVPISPEDYVEARQQAQ